MVSLSQFLGPDRISIRWKRLGAVLFGAGIFAYFEGVVATLLALADIPISLIGQFAMLLGELVGTFAGTWPAVIDATVLEAQRFIATTGLGGFLVAILLVLVMLYGLAQVISRVR